jgi:hypothetical protein
MPQELARVPGGNPVLSRRAFSSAGVTEVSPEDVSGDFGQAMMLNRLMPFHTTSVVSKNTSRTLC